MEYWLNLTLFKMGFWLTWALIPIVVEIIPAFFSIFRLFLKNLRHKKLEMPDKMPFISVIVPVYNSEDTLYRCIQSIHDSTYPTELVQVILADNQSTDSSFEVFSRAHSHFSDMHMQLIHTEQGKAKALNSAIYESIGTYIFNIDSDGVLESHALMNMVLRFENDYDAAAMTGTILTQKEQIKTEKGFFRKILNKNEYFEYAQAFLSGRVIESDSNQMFTMSGAFSAFRKEALLNTFMYSTSTVGEDTDMTFQIREKLKRKVVICSDAIFYIEPINRLSQLYTQRQRWQRGEIEVSQEYSKHIELKNFFSNFLIRRMIIDHTFLFPKMIWIFASIALLFFRYSVIMMAMSYFIIYILYVVVALFNYVCVRMLLRDFTEERRFYTRLAWVALTLPIYNFVVAFIRFVGILNTMKEMAVWNTKKFDDEVGSVRSVFKEDLQRVKETRK